VVTRQQAVSGRSISPRRIRHRFSTLNRIPFPRLSASVRCRFEVLLRTDTSEETDVKKALAIVLIVGFVSVDFLFFHDILKPGEVVTFPQYLTGLLSIPVMVLAFLYLLRSTGILRTR
jgi:hypothetical protein